MLVRIECLVEISVDLWMLKLSFLNFALSLNLALTLRSKLQFLRLKLNIQIALQIFEIDNCKLKDENWDEKWKKNEMEMENEIGNWVLKCSCSRVHLFVFVSIVLLLLFEKGCALNFIFLPVIVHVFEKHVCGHCCSEKFHYGSFSEWVL